jgi:Fe-Mn family superoxide dismutase
MPDLSCGLFHHKKITKMAFQLPALPYAFDALEPHIDAHTMEIHHGKHHAAYTNNLNAAIAGTPLEGQTIEQILANISQHSPAIRNNGGGYYNHNLFWEIMSPDGGGEPSAQMNIAKAIDRDFGSFEEFKKQFTAAATTRFGSGWAWLCTDADDKLFITSTPNQDNPLMDVADKKGTPVLGLDVWEHAYYLNYQNRRPDYISAFFNVINWQEVTRRYNDANAGAMKA